MKKQKTPILLVSLLVVLVLGVVGFGLYHGSSGPKKLDDTQQTLQPDQAPTANSVGNLVRKNTSGRSAAKEPSPDSMLPKRMTPSITATDNPTMPKPTPNPSGSTDSQWYVHD